MNAARSHDSELTVCCHCPIGPSMRRPVSVKLVLQLPLIVEWSSSEPGRLCRHPSIRTLWRAIFARCKLGVLVSVGAATCESTSILTDSVRVGPQDLVAVTWTRRLSSALRIQLYATALTTWWLFRSGS